MGAQIVRFRRALPLACYWDRGRLIVYNYHSGEQSLLPPLAAELLTYCETWRTTADVCGRFRAYPATAVKALVSLLSKRTLLDRASDGAPHEHLFRDWAKWMPAAALFHFATKNVHYGDADGMRRKLVRKARRDPAPPAVKRYPGSRRALLPAPERGFDLARVLGERRTWRRFDPRKPFVLQHAATLLGLTWGVQRWARTVVGDVPLKTSPSGGARHPIEAYLFARRVEGLAPGWYHYDADAHALEAVAPAGRAATPAAYLRQPAYRSVPALFVMSAVFARTRWAYDNARAYRVVLLDAGHLGQTFCLVATALGLAPFCSAALDDARVERELGLDGISESVVYGCGVGIRPPGVDWAPMPDPGRTPRVRLSTWARRKQPSR